MIELVGEKRKWKCKLMSYFLVRALADFLNPEFQSGIEREEGRSPNIVQLQILTLGCILQSWAEQ